MHNDAKRKRCKMILWKFLFFFLAVLTWNVIDFYQFFWQSKSIGIWINEYKITFYCFCTDWMHAAIENWIFILLIFFLLLWARISIEINLHAMKRRQVGCICCYAYNITSTKGMNKRKKKKKKTLKRTLCTSVILSFLLLFFCSLIQFSNWFFIVYYDR